MVHPRSFTARMEGGILGKMFRPLLECCKHSINCSYYCYYCYYRRQLKCQRPSSCHQTFLHQIPLSKPQPRSRLFGRLLLRGVPQRALHRAGGEGWVIENRHSSAVHTLHLLPLPPGTAGGEHTDSSSQLRQGKHVFLLQGRRGHMKPKAGIPRLPPWMSPGPLGSPT